MILSGRSGFVPYKKILQIQRHADGLLVFDIQDDSISGWQFAKIFEYLFAGKPILCIGAEGKTAGRLVEESGCGTNYGRDTQRLSDALVNLLTVHRLPYSPREDVLAQYSRQVLADKMLIELIKLTESKHV
jgi:hypothetical protein